MHRNLLRMASTSMLAASALNVLNVSAANAQHHGGDYHGSDFHGRDYHNFFPAERRIWRSGRWEHGRHDNRYAWWWSVGGGWYSYPEPIYPFPTYVPPAVMVQQPPPMPSGLPPAQSWYFCDNPQGYFPYVAACHGPWREFPYVAACNGPWREVPATSQK
jgi:hypothetical protein